LDFAGASGSVIKAIRQRELLNSWLALYARGQSLPQLADYRPDRLDDEKPDTVLYSVDAAIDPPRLIIQSEGTRMASAYGNTGKGRALDAYVGPRLAPFVMPAYYECVKRRLPVYTVTDLDDVYGRVVAYERLLMPFGQENTVTDVIASVKMICEDGGFELNNLMRANDTLPRPRLCVVIDRDLYHRAPGRIPAGDPIEFD
jgi:hypothetical protein